MLVGGYFFWNFSGGNKKGERRWGDSMLCGSSVGGTCRGWLISYSLVSYFLKLGIWLWTECVCLCIWNISLLLLTCFCSWVLQLITQVLMLVVSLCKPVICKLKILGVGNLNIINQWGEPQKGGTKFWNFRVGEAKGGNTIFDSNLVGWKILEETMDYECSIK